MARYTAFISYSHKDRAFADWLHRRLEAYRVPKRLVGTPGRDGPVPARLYPVFRDREELPTSDDLSAQILGALDGSATLIVICSPAAAASRWVNEEILTFRRLGRGARILAVIAEGEPNARLLGGAAAERECFPLGLVEAEEADGAPRVIEPIAADARPEGDGRENALLKIIAGMLGIGFEALRQRELEAQRRRTRVAQGIAAAMILLAVLAAGAGGLAWQARGVAEAERGEAVRQRGVAEEQRGEAVTQRNLARERQREAEEQRVRAETERAESLRQESTVLARIARDRTAGGDAMGGMLVALEALPGVTERPWTEAAEMALLEAWAGLTEVATWRLPDGPVLALAVDGEGRRVVAGGVGGQLLLWDARAPEEPGRVLVGHRGPVTLARFSADGGRLLTAGGDSRALLWFFGRGANDPVEFRLEADFARAAAIAPDGRALLVAGNFGPVTLWREAAGKWHAEPLAFHPLAVQEASFSADGRRFAVLDGQMLRVFTLPADGPPSLLVEVEAGDTAERMALAPDGRALALGGLQAARLWRVGARQPMDLPGGEVGIEALVIGGDESWVVGGGRDGAILVWSAEGDLLARLGGHVGPVEALSFFGADVLVSAGQDGTTRFWLMDGAASRQIGLHAGHVGAVVDAVLAGTPSRLVTAGRDGTLRVFDPLRQRTAAVLPAGREAIRRAFLDPTGRWWLGLTEGRAPELRITDLDASGAPPVRIALTNRVVAGPVTDAGARRVAAVSRGLLAWEREAGGGFRPLVLAEAEAAGPGPLALDRGGRWLAAAPEALSVLLLWDLTAPERPPLRLPQRQGRLGALAVAEDGRRVVGGGSDGPVWLWDTGAPDTPPRRLAGHSAAVRSLVFAPDGATLASGSADRSLRLWNLETGEAQLLPSPGGAVRDIAFAPSGGQMLVAAEDGARLWSLTGRVPIGATIQRASAPRQLRALDRPGVVRLLDGTGEVRDLAVPAGPALIAAARAELTRCLGDAERQGFGLAVTGREGLQPPGCGTSAP